MAEDLRQFEEKVEKLEQKIGQLENDLRNAKGNVTALSVVIGLMADKYPENLASQYIRECVGLGLNGDLMKKEDSALRYLARIMSGETYEQLVKLCAGCAEMDPEPEFEMPDTSKAAKAPVKRTKPGRKRAKAAAVAETADETAGAADAK